MSQKLKDQIAIVTGASSGIGTGVAKALAAEGASVVVNYSSSPDKAKKVLDEIQEAGGKGIVIKADVSNEKEVVEMFQKTIAEFHHHAGIKNN